MTFQPVIGVGGYTGWLVLQRTEERQREVFDNSALLNRNIEYFKENIGNVRSAEDLVTDRQLLSVALGAFGLNEEIDKRAFVRQILESDPADTSSLLSRMTDPRFDELNETFAFSRGGPDGVDGGEETESTEPTSGDAPPMFSADFAEGIIARYKEREFEQAVGESDQDMRLALNFEREVPNLLDEGGETAESTFWFKVMGQEPLRRVFETAFNLPSEFSQIDIDRQVEVLAEQAERFLGTSVPEEIATQENMDTVVRRYFTIQQINSGPDSTTPGFAALSLLSGGGLGAAGIENLLISQS